MSAYSSDLRERVIAMAGEPNVTQPKLAAMFALSLSTVEEWLRTFRQTGRTQPLPHAGGAKRVLQPHARVIQQIVKQQPDATLEELCTQVAAKTGVRATASMMCRELQILKLPRKKVVTRQSMRHPARPKITAGTSSQDDENLAFHRRTPQIHR